MNYRNSLHSHLFRVAAFAGLLTFASLPAFAQFPGLTLPPGGDNQKSVVTQHMGFVSVTVTYNSPDVHSPTGDDRTGKIWGQLVPYGFTSLGFGNGNPGPWRAGANENTTIEFSHDVEIEGKALGAGRYGLHYAVDESEWTAIFSRNADAWGSFFYEEDQDALRVAIKPEKAEYREWLTYDFIDRQLDSTTLALHWENLRAPMTISVPKMVDQYVSVLKRELTGSPGFGWQNWNAAALFLVNRDTEGTYNDLALEWADAAISAPFVGQENFATLTTKSQVQRKAGDLEDAMATLDKAVVHPTAGAGQVHQLGRTLIGMGAKDKALEVFQKNHERFDGAWPTEVGMARGLSAVGRYDEAQKHARIAHEQAPDDLNRNALEGMIERLGKGEDVN